MKRVLIAASLLLADCGQSAASKSHVELRRDASAEGGRAPPSEAGTPPARDTGTPPARDTGTPPAGNCPVEKAPATTLSCTGLYADIAAKTLSGGVRTYSPAVPLWSDGAEKTRWIALPDGTKIDASDPNEWTFPIGTKVWKEFVVGGKRVETRLFQKTLVNHWVHAAYAWNEDETEATVSAGGDIQGPLGRYHIPINSECEDCHRGRTDRILGFEQVSLGLAGATGLTLATLVSEGLISPKPAKTTLTVGDDGTGHAAAPLEWLHVNCGVTCHNDNSDAIAYGAKMRLRLDPTELDGRSVTSMDAFTTTVGALVNTPGWAGKTRIVPGDPADSLLVTLISSRSTVNTTVSQMPPIASLVVDTADVKQVVDWISRMPHPPTEAGVRDSDAPRDAGPSPPEARDARAGHD